MATSLNMTAFSFFQGFFCPCSFSPWLLLLLTSTWFLLHRLVSPLLPLVFLPAAGRTVHRQKWRRWKQLRVSQAQWKQHSRGKDVGEIPPHERQGSPRPQQELSEKQKTLRQRSPPKQLQENANCGSQGGQQALQLGRRKDDKEEFQVGDSAELKNSRPSDIAVEPWKSASTNDQAWTILNRDDAKGAAIDEQQEWEENAGLRRRFAASKRSEAAEDAPTESKEEMDVPKAESLVMHERDCSEGTGAAAKEAGPPVAQEDSAGEESGIAAAAGQLVAAAAHEGAAAVAREGAEEAAAGEEETDTGDKRRDEMNSDKLERQSLEKYFVMANANVIGMLHALYLTPAALYYSIRNVVLPAAELVLAERAAAVATKPVDASHSSHAATAADVFENSDQLSSDRHLYDLLATYLFHWDKAPSFWDGSSDCLVIFSAYVMTSYFVWDTVDCFQHYKVHGRAFFFHALLSLLAGILQVSARGIRLAGLCSMFAVSEISTPFLHFRWFLIQNGLGRSRLCTVTTLWTVFLFILVRAFMVPCLVFSHYWGDLFSYHKYILREDARISVLRALFMLALTVAWTALNLFWCFLFFRSLARRRSRSSRVLGSEKYSASRNRAHKLG